MYIGSGERERAKGKVKVLRKSNGSEWTNRRKGKVRKDGFEVFRAVIIKTAVVWNLIQLMFQRKLLPPCSGLKRK
jgi:hypothetical protein